MVLPPAKGIASARSAAERRKKKEAWLKLRKEGLGASDAAAACGLSRYCQPVTLWKDKVTEAVNAEDITVGEEVNEAIEWGNYAEGRIRQKAKQHFFPDDPHGIINPGRYRIQRHAEHRWMTATLDGWIQEPNDKILELYDGFPAEAFDKIKGRGVLEIKTSGHENDWGDNAMEYPLEYMCQVQHAMAVMGYSWGILACLLAGYGGLRVKYFGFVEVEEFQAALIAKERDFWLNNVERRVAPDLVDSNIASQIDSLKALFTTELSGKVVELEPEYDVVDEINQAAMALRRKADVIAGFCKATLIARIQNGEMGVLNNGAAYTFKTQERKGYEVKPRSDRVLRRSNNKAKIEAARGIIDAETSSSITSD
jgi:putative phage-type endonuclease